MTQEYTLTDIKNAILRVMDNPMMELVRPAVIEGLNQVSPAAGVARDILLEYNAFKLSRLMDGLSSGLNCEKWLNELYNYINASPEKAITVANLFKQTVNAECHKVCVIYGLILAGHMQSGTKLTHEEMIVCKALENATEYDLINFKEIMEKYLQSVPKGDRVVIPKDLPEKDEVMTTCDWCVYNRIFVSHIFEWGEIGEATLDLDTYYYATQPAKVLLQYIYAAQQVWEYGNK